MSQIVRRAAETPVAQGQADDLLPAKTHRVAGMFVTSQVGLGIEPKLYLSWAVQPSYWESGYTLLVFHSTSGFSPEKYPDDLNRHGRLIIETTRDAYHEERPEEGPHYFTFILYKKSLFGLSENLSVVRFSETIPSAKVAISRIKNKVELEEMRRQHELSQIEHEANLDEAEMRRLHAKERLADMKNPSNRKKATGADAIIAEELAGIDATVDALVAKGRKIEELKKDPRFKKLTRAERDDVIQRINERLDAAEISARRDMRG